MLNLSKTDVFDTGFFRQWPYATLMTTKPNDFKTYYPTDVMETGWDILFFWVARMMFGLYRTGKIHFKDVYLHGLVGIKKGRRCQVQTMSSILEVADIYEPTSCEWRLSAQLPAMIRSFQKTRSEDIEILPEIWNASASF